MSYINKNGRKSYQTVDSYTVTLMSYISLTVSLARVTSDSYTVQLTSYIKLVMLSGKTSIVILYYKKLHK